MRLSHAGVSYFPLEKIGNPHSRTAQQAEMKLGSDPTAAPLSAVMYCDRTRKNRMFYFENETRIERVGLRRVLSVKANVNPGKSR